MTRRERRAIFQKISKTDRRIALKPFIEERDKELKAALIKTKKLNDTELAEFLIMIKGRAFVWRIVKNTLKDNYYREGLK